MVERGLDLEVVTTRSLSLEFDTHHVVRWRSQAADEATLPGMTIHRRAAWNLPGVLESRLERAIDAGATRARSSLPLFSVQTYLGRVFHQLEHSTTVGWFRWTSPRANLVVGEPGASELSLLVHVLVPTTLEARCSGSILFRERLEPERQRQIVLQLPRSGPCVVQLRCSPPFQPPGELRRLGVGVAALGVVAGGAAVAVPLDRDEAAFEATVATPVLAAHHSIGQPWKNKTARSPGPSTLLVSTNLCIVISISELRPCWHRDKNGDWFGVDLENSGRHLRYQ